MGIRSAVIAFVTAIIVFGSTGDDAAAKASRSQVAGSDIRGVARESRALRAHVRRGSIVRVTWLRCPVRLGSTCRPRGVGRGMGYRLRAADVAMRVRARIRVRTYARRSIRTGRGRVVRRVRVIRTVHTRWVGPVRPRPALRPGGSTATPGASPPTAATAGVAATGTAPVATNIPSAPVALGATSQIGDQWTMSVLGVDADAGNQVAMLDADAPTAPAGTRYVALRVRVINGAGVARSAPSEQIALRCGGHVATRAPVESGDGLSADPIPAGGQREGAIYWICPAGHMEMSAHGIAFSLDG